jgi:hypothetical protein
MLMLPTQCRGDLPDTTCRYDARLPTCFLPFPRGLRMMRDRVPAKDRRFYDARMRRLLLTRREVRRIVEDVGRSRVDSTTYSRTSGLKRHTGC